MCSRDTIVWMAADASRRHHPINYILDYFTDSCLRPRRKNSMESNCFCLKPVWSTWLVCRSQDIGAVRPDLRVGSSNFLTAVRLKWTSRPVHIVLYWCPDPLHMYDIGLFILSTCIYVPLHSSFKSWVLVTSWIHMSRNCVYAIIEHNHELWLVERYQMLRPCLGRSGALVPAAFCQRWNWLDRTDVSPHHHLINCLTPSWTHPW